MPRLVLLLLSFSFFSMSPLCAGSNSISDPEMTADNTTIEDVNYAETIIATHNNHNNNTSSMCEPMSCKSNCCDASGECPLEESECYFFKCENFMCGEGGYCEKNVCVTRSSEFQSTITSRLIAIFLVSIFVMLIECFQPQTKRFLEALLLKPNPNYKQNPQLSTAKNNLAGTINGAQVVIGGALTSGNTSRYIGQAILPKTSLHEANIANTPILQAMTSNYPPTAITTANAILLDFQTYVEPTPTFASVSEPTQQQQQQQQQPLKVSNNNIQSINSYGSFPLSENPSPIKSQYSLLQAQQQQSQQQHQHLHHLNNHLISPFGLTARRTNSHEQQQEQDVDSCNLIQELEERHPSEQNEVQKPYVISLKSSIAAGISAKVSVAAPTKIINSTGETKLI